MIIKRKKFNTILLLLFSVVTISGQEAKSHRYLFESPPGESELTRTEKGFILRYNISELNLKSIRIAEGNFYRLSIPGHALTSEHGMPEMPVYSKLILLPDPQSTVVVKIHDAKTKIIHPGKDSFKGLIFPRQIEQPKNQEKKIEKFIIERGIYKNKGFIPTDTVKVEYIGTIRNQAIANLYIYPVRYNPRANILEVITSMTLEVEFKDYKGSFAAEQKEPLPFIQTFSKGVLNYSIDDLIPGYSAEPLKMVIITDTIFSKVLKPYINWKTQKGFRITTLYKGNDLAGSTFAELKDTLYKIYNYEYSAGSAPVYLLIIGDVTRIPVSDVPSNYTDLYYSTFDGDGDYLPEMFTGRLPVADSNELKAVLKKLIMYEKFEFADTNIFYRKSLITAGNDAGYADYMNGQLKYAEKYYLNESYGIENHIFYYPQSVNAKDSIINLLNGGLGFVNYSGHGDAYGWLSPEVKSEDIIGLTNKNMYPFVISNACKTGMFNISGSFGNTLIKSDEKGASGFIGCSNDSYWDEDFYWTVGAGTISADPVYEDTGLGAYDRLFHKSGEKASEWYVTMGQIVYSGNLSVTASPSSKKKYYWEIYNLIGDPSIIPFIGAPDTFNISLPDTLPNKIRSLSFISEPYSYIAISHFDTLWDASFVSPSGSVTLDIPERSNDSCLIVITGQNKIPLTKKIYISEIEKEYINLSGFEINDIQGNNNGKADYGERLYLKLTIDNLGQTTENGLFIKINSSSQNGFTIVNDSVFLGDLLALSEVVTDNILEIKIDDLIPDNSYITINIQIKGTKTEKEYIKDIRLYSPKPQLLNCIVDDSPAGNGDLIADPGESINLVVRIINDGSSPVSGDLIVNNTPTGVIVHSYSIPIGILNPGEEKPVEVPVTVTNLLKEGDTFEISFTADCNPYFANKNFIIPIGRINESFEYQTFSMFSWNNSYSNPWIITSDQAYEGYFSARSGQISHSNESGLSLKVNIPYNDSITFAYRVSSEKNYDFLYFKVNGKEIFKVSGETGWLESKVAVYEGFNTFEWIYKKDESVTSGADCAWLDYLRFPAGAFNKIDLKTEKIISPEEGKKLGLETITAKVINLGIDTLYKFNMAYIINNNPPVGEKFIYTINPGDTITVSFAVKADFTMDGIYVLKVYGFNNDDSYFFNDTTTITIMNTGIEDLLVPGSDITVMPNPFSESINILINSKSFESLKFTLLDITGNTVREIKKNIIPGENYITIDSGDLLPGYYTLSINGKSILKTIRLIKSYR